MATVTKGTELIITLGNDVGAGADLFGFLKKAEVNVVASSCYQIRDEVTFSIVPDNLETALEVMQSNDLTPNSKQVLLVEMPNTPGALADLLKQIADLGVNVRSAYATTSAKKSALAILMTDNDDKVLEKLGE